MYQTIHELISVAGIYEDGRFRPVKFRWQNRLFSITEVCSVHDFKDGSVLKRRFSVLVETTVYLLEFDRQQEKWYLEEIWIEN